MKRITIILSILMVALSMSAQDHWTNHFVGSAAFDISSDQNSSRYSFKGFDVKGEYKIYLVKGLFVAPGANLYYEDYTTSGLFSWGITELEDLYSRRFGIEISAMGGYTVPASSAISWDFYTGPSFRHHIIAREKRSNGTHNNIGDEKFCNWVALRWTFGLGINIKRISVRGEFSLAMTNDYYEKVRNLYSIRVGYNF